MSVLKYIKECNEIYQTGTTPFPTYQNNIEYKNRNLFFSIPPNKKNLPVLIWFNTDLKNVCYYNSKWWLNENNFNNCKNEKNSENGGYWLLDLYKKLEENVVIICLNASSNDNWSFNDSKWYDSNIKDFGYPGPTYDKDFIKTVINYFFIDNYSEILNKENVFFGGWGNGCQMTSRMFQVVNEEDTISPITSIVGGIMISGGSYHCYEDPDEGKVMNECKECKNICNENKSTCCAYCCPKNTTESYYNNKERYTKHPLCFLSQHTDDNNFGINAAKKYFCTLKNNIQNKHFICYKEQFEINPNTINSDTNYLIHLNSKLPSNYCKPTIKSWKSFNDEWECDNYLVFDKRLVYPVRNFILVNTSNIGYYNKLHKTYNYKHNHYDTNLMIILSLSIGIPFVLILIYILRDRI